MAGAVYFHWPDEAIETLRKLWAEGVSAAQIAKEIGNSITRNAVIGKLHRLGLHLREHDETKQIKKQPLPALSAAAQIDGAAKQANGRYAQKVEHWHARSAEVAKASIRQRPLEVGTLADGNEGNWPHLPSAANGSISFHDLKAHHCRFPFGQRAPFLFCGEPRASNSSYCAEHRRLCYPASQVLGVVA
jgi:GcrA cell cycle regulator